MLRRGWAGYLFGVAFFSVALVCGDASAISFAETQTLTVANPHSVEDLGFSVAASGGLAIVGAINDTNASNQTTGAAFVYRQSPAGQWGQVAKLVPADALDGDIFGSSVAIDGDTAIVEARDRGGLSSAHYGAAYLFHRNSDSNWTQVGEFTAPANTTSYWAQVAISGPRAVVTGILQQNFTGHWVINVLGQTAPNTWANTQNIIFPGNYTSQINDIALNQGTLFAGGYEQNSQGGQTTYAVEVYTNSPSGFQHSQTILPPAPSLAFGSSVSADGDRLLVGASFESDHGAAYIYERSPSGIWAEVAHLVAPDITQRMYFGREVVLDGDLAYVSSWQGVAGGDGDRVDVFQRDSTGNWTDIAKLKSAFAPIDFGRSLAVDGGQLLVGSGVNTPGVVNVFSQVPEPALTYYAICVLGCIAGKQLWRPSRHA